MEAVFLGMIPDLISLLSLLFTSIQCPYDNQEVIKNLHVRKITGKRLLALEQRNVIFLINAKGETGLI